MSATRTSKEGRVNVPLGKAKSELKALAGKSGTSESNFARVLILDGIARIKSGEIKFIGPSLESSNPHAA
jgi:predicted ABC-type transport system involved in lysophospholipase L1 biosynthesis ATPase subunit